MKIFVPRSEYVPSGFGVAVVRRSARDDPACGSVIAIVPKKRPESRCLRYRSFWSGEPNAVRIAALPIVSETYAVVDTLAAVDCSSHTRLTVAGSGILTLWRSDAW